MKIREMTDKDIEIYHILMQLKEQSKCVDKQVACVIVDNSYNIVSQGVNVVYHCDKNCHDKENRICEVMHAEITASCNLISTRCHTYLKAYVSLCPCIPCQKALDPYVDEIVYFGMTHRDLDPKIENKIVCFPHLHYKIHKNEGFRDNVRKTKNAFHNLINGLERERNTFLFNEFLDNINKIIDVEIQIEQLKLWLSDSNNEFYNILRRNRNIVFKKLLKSFEDKENEKT